MRVLAVFEKEIAEALKNRMLLFSLIPLPLLFTTIPLAIAYFTRGQPLKPGEAEIYYRLSPAFANMNPGDVALIMVLGQFMFLFLLIPLMVPMTIATFSIIGEKQARSLEPLLATPIRTWELLLGKSLAATLPAVLVTWISYAILIAGMAVIASPIVFASVVSGLWMLAIAVLAPLLAIMAVNAGVLISSRVNDTRVAQQIGGLVAIPLIALGMGQTMGLVLYSVPMFAAGALAMVVLDGALLVAAAKLFRRETILTTWK